MLQSLTAMNPLSKLKTGRFAIVGQNIAKGANQAGVGTGAVTADGIGNSGSSGGNLAAAGNTAGRKLLAKVGK